MEIPAVTKQMIGYHKAVFNNTYYGVTVLQDYSQNMMEGYLRLFPWISEENKKNFNNSLEYIKQSRENYKKSVDQGFNQIEELIGKKK